MLQVAGVRRLTGYGLLEAHGEVGVGDALVLGREARGRDDRIHLHGALIGVHSSVGPGVSQKRRVVGCGDPGSGQSASAHPEGDREAVLHPRAGSDERCAGQQGEQRHGGAAAGAQLANPRGGDPSRSFFRK